MEPVDVLGINPVRPANCIGQRMRLGRNRDEMDMVPHQTIAENLQTVFARQVIQNGQVPCVVVINEENILPVVSALDDMMRASGNDNSRYPRHVPIIL